MVSRAHSIVGANPEGRPALDFYPTPADAVEDLLRVEMFMDPIWEPACGDGAISKVLAAKGYRTISTDVADYGFDGARRLDFLKPFSVKNSVGAVITNPPYKDAQAFVEKALTVSHGKVAMLLKLAFLEGQKRTDFYEKTPPVRVWVFRRRIQLTRNGEPMKNGGMIAFAWFVWEKGFTGKPTIGWL